MREDPLDSRVTIVLKALTLATLRETQGNRTHAAKQMGIALRTLRNWIRKWDLKEEDWNWMP